MHRVLGGQAGQAACCGGAPGGDGSTKGAPCPQVAICAAYLPARLGAAPAASFITSLHLKAACQVHTCNLAMDSNLPSVSHCSAWCCWVDLLKQLVGCLVTLCRPPSSSRRNNGGGSSKARGRRRGSDRDAAQCFACSSSAASRVQGHHCAVAVH